METGNFAINNLTTGDTLNLMADLEDGYTCVWVYNDDANNIKESDQQIYTIHVGDSFSFAVQNKAATVKYYFVPINDRLPNAIVHGRIIRPTQTLRTKGSERVNINNSSTYQAVQGADITIGSLGTNSGVVNGKTYYTTTQTDANGYFDVLVPHGMEGLLTNLILANGENVSPEEIENQFAYFQPIKEIVVYEKDNNITAEVFPDPDYVSEDIRAEIQAKIDEVNETFPPAKRIVALVIRDTEFEKTASKKIIRSSIIGK